MLKKASLYLFFSLLILKTYGQNKEDMSKYPLNAMNNNSSLQLVFYISGDGGWNSFSQKLCAELAQRGYAVVCLDSKKYFWEEKAMDTFVKDASDIINYYLKVWKKDKFSIVGYSFGADAATFLPSRLAKPLKDRIKTNVLLIPSSSSDLVIKLTDIFGFGNKDGKYKVLPEIIKTQVPTLCVFAKDDENDLASQLVEKTNLKKIVLPGSHKFDNDVKRVAQVVASGL